MQTGASAVVLAAFASPFACAQRQSATSLSANSGTIAGLVRDAAGMPQMGALIQVLLPGADSYRIALTDSRGRYRLTDIPPGTYEIRATAALFLPAVRSHLHIDRGTHSIVNLTMGTLLDAAPWLPAARRSGTESVDDWTWTLRSSANRPILRVTDHTSAGASHSVSYSSSAVAERRNTVSQARVTLLDGDGGFGHGGTHDVFLIATRGGDDAGVLRADFSGPRQPYPVNPSADISLGVSRPLPAGGQSRSLLSFVSHPELAGANGSVGMQAAVLRNAQRFELGDAVRIDAGSVLTDVNMGGNALALEPFLRVSLQTMPGLHLVYSYTAARGTESYDDLDVVQAALPVAISKDGRLRLATGHHQALAAATRLGEKGTLEFAAYRDVTDSNTLGGSGTLTAQDLAGGGVISDPTTQSFRAQTRGYNAAGIRVFVSQPLTPALTVSGQFTTGEALAASSGDGTVPLATALAGLHTRHAYSAQVSADGKLVRAGTSLHASYRWQPEDLLTPVDAFHNSLQGAYLSCILRQPLRLAHILPDGVEAVVDVNNLLAQGYQPFLSRDGRTLFLAESPRMLQAGVSFNF